MSILKNSQKKMFSNENSETAIFCEVSLRIRRYFCDQNWTFYGRKRQQSGQKSHSIWFFAISWIQCILIYPMYDNFNMSPTHSKIFRQIAQIDYYVTILSACFWHFLFLKKNAQNLAKIMKNVLPCRPWRVYLKSQSVALQGNSWQSRKV
mgnify:CR=1 FL=1